MRKSSAQLAVIGWKSKGEMMYIERSLSLKEAGREGWIQVEEIVNDEKVFLIPRRSAVI